MLKIRYDKIRSSSCADNDQVATETAILQNLSVHLQEEKVHTSSIEMKDTCLFHAQRCYVAFIESS